MASGSRAPAYSDTQSVKKKSAPRLDRLEKLGVGAARSMAPDNLQENPKGQRPRVRNCPGGGPTHTPDSPQSS